MEGRREMFSEIANLASIPTDVESPNRKPIPTSLRFEPDLAEFLEPDRANEFVGAVDGRSSTVSDKLAVLETLDSGWAIALPLVLKTRVSANRDRASNLTGDSIDIMVFVGIYLVVIFLYDPIANFIHRI